MASQADRVEKAALILALILVGNAVLEHALGSKWKKFTSAEGSFSVLMPGKPENETQSFSVGEVEIEEHSFVVHSRMYGDFTLGYIDNPAISDPSRAEAVFDWQAPVLRHPQDIISSERMAINGFPVRQYKIRAEADLLADERIYLVGRRMYVLLVVHGKDNDESGVTRFFESFTFQPGDRQDRGARPRTSLTVTIGAKDILFCARISGIVRASTANARRNGQY